MDFRKRLLTIIAFAAIVGGAVAIAIPGSPVSPIPSGLELTRQGDTSGAIQAAGADVSYASPKGALGVVERFLPPGNYTDNYPILPRGIVIHNTDSPAALGCDPVYNTFAGPRQASTHFCIDENGVIEQYIRLEHISWGQGDVRNPNMGIVWIADVVRNDGWMNQYAWSIELTLCNVSPATGCSHGPELLEDYPLMKASLTTLTKFLLGQAGLPANRQSVVAHNDINGATRVDPICCWVQGGVGAGAIAFDQWVASLAPTIPNGLPGGPPVIDGWLPPLIQLEGGAHVYLVVGGIKLHVCDPAVFEAQGLLWENIVTVTSDNLLWQLPALMCR